MSVQFNLVFPQQVLSLLLPARLSIIAFLLYFLLTRTLWSWSWIRPEAGHETRSEMQAANVSSNSNSNSSSGVVVVRKSQGDRAHNRQGGAGWRKKIALRKKNFGRLEEWSSDRDMKKVLLWTGYGPLQEGMQLWRRVFSDIGRTLNISRSITS